MTWATGRVSPQVVLLDFGQSKALSEELRLALARMIVALSGGDVEDIVRAMEGLGLSFGSRHGAAQAADVLDVVTMAHIFFDTRYLVAAQVNPLSEEAVIHNTPLKEFPSWLYMVMRTVLLLRGLTFAMGMDVSTADMWKPHALRALAEGEVGRQRARENMHIDLTHDEL